MSQSARRVRERIIAMEILKLEWRQALLHAQQKAKP
jgi:hypothetical protein